MELSLLYLIANDLTDAVAIWRVLSEQFQCKPWVNKLELKQKLFSLRLDEDGSVQYIKRMTEIWSAIGECVSDEDRVVYLLASLLESFSVLVTALKLVQMYCHWLLGESVCYTKKPSWKVNLLKKEHWLWVFKKGYGVTSVINLAILRSNAKNMQNLSFWSNLLKWKHLTWWSPLMMK